MPLNNPPDSLGLRRWTMGGGPGGRRGCGAVMFEAVVGVVGFDMVVVAVVQVIRCVWHGCMCDDDDDILYPLTPHVRLDVRLSFQENDRMSAFTAIDLPKFIQLLPRRRPDNFTLYNDTHSTQQRRRPQHPQHNVRPLPPHRSLTLGPLPTPTRALPIDPLPSL